MEITVERQEYDRYGNLTYMIVGKYNYPLDHKFTPIERDAIDRLTVHSDCERISLEWLFSSTVASINRVFINKIEYRIAYNQKIDIDKVLAISKELIDKMVTIALMNPTNRSVRKKLRDTIIKIIEECLGKGGDNNDRQNNRNNS